MGRGDRHRFAFGEVASCLGCSVLGGCHMSSDLPYDDCFVVFEITLEGAHNQEMLLNKKECSGNSMDDDNDPIASGVRRVRSHAITGPSMVAGSVH